MGCSERMGDGGGIREEECLLEVSSLVLLSKFCSIFGCLLVKVLI